MLSGGTARLTSGREGRDARFTEASSAVLDVGSPPPVKIFRKDVAGQRDIQAQQETRIAGAAALRNKMRYSAEELMGEKVSTEMHRTKRASYPSLPCYDCGRASKCICCDKEELTEMLLEPRMVRKMRDKGTMFDRTCLLDEGLITEEQQDKENEVEEEFARLNDAIYDWTAKCEVLRERNKKLLEEKDTLFNANVSLKEKLRFTEGRMEELEEATEELEGKVARRDQELKEAAESAERERRRAQHTLDMAHEHRRGSVEFLADKSGALVEKARAVQGWKEVVLARKYEKVQKRLAEADRRAQLDLKVAETQKETALRKLKEGFAKERQKLVEERDEEKKQEVLKGKKLLKESEQERKKLEAKVEALEQRLQKRVDEMAHLNKQLRRHSEMEDDLHNDAAAKTDKLAQLQADLTKKEYELALSRNRSPEKEIVEVEKPSTGLPAIDEDALREKIKQELLLTQKQSLEVDELHEKLAKASRNLAHTRERLEQEQAACEKMAAELVDRRHKVESLELQVSLEIRHHLQAQEAFHALVRKLQHMQLELHAKDKTIQRKRVKDPYLAENYEGQKLLSAELSKKVNAMSRRMKLVHKLAARLKAPSIRALFQRLTSSSSATKGDVGKYITGKSSTADHSASHHHNLARSGANSAASRVENTLNRRDVRDQHGASPPTTSGTMLATRGVSSPDNFKTGDVDTAGRPKTKTGSAVTAYLETLALAGAGTPGGRATSASPRSASPKSKIGEPTKFVIETEVERKKQIPPDREGYARGTSPRSQAAAVGANKGSEFLYSPRRSTSVGQQKLSPGGRSHQERGWEINTATSSRKAPDHLLVVNFSGNEFELQPEQKDSCSQANAARGGLLLNDHSVEEPLGVVKNDDNLLLAPDEEQVVEEDLRQADSASVASSAVTQKLYNTSMLFPAPKSGLASNYLPSPQDIAREQAAYSSSPFDLELPSGRYRSPPPAAQKQRAAEKRARAPLVDTAPIISSPGRRNEDELRDVDSSSVYATDTEQLTRYV
ncbi:unnamed protein product [Amoebophrya sp. A120]|nr:unnamed protein product [Amoebophrya sp. A120]|eukprot:GSA120T00006487001.1